VAVDATSSAILGQMQGANANLAQLVEAMRSSFSAMTASQGTFTCAAAATTTVTDAKVKATSFIALMPLNAPAATLMAGSHSLYISARTAGASFTVATADAGSAAGTEAFGYLIANVG
jgi:hypothetical protein